MTTGFRSSFQDELNSIIQKGISHLIKTDLFDPATHGPDVEKIIEEVISTPVETLGVVIL